MKESIKKKTLRLQSIYQKLVDKYPQVECALLYNNPFELLIATILSAQCTDARVNMVTPILFNRYPNVFALADATIDELEHIIYSTGFYKAKSTNMPKHEIIKRKIQHHLPHRQRQSLNLDVHDSEQTK